MQVASAYPSSLHHSHYHTYYQLHTPGPQDHELKRQYLALLPLQQVIEICLTFDAYVSPYVKSTIWPHDLNAAIAALQKAKSSSTTTLEAESATKNGAAAVMDSLNPPDEKEDAPAPSESTPAMEPQPPDKEKSSTPDPLTTSTVSEPAPSISSTPLARITESSSSTASTSSLPAASSESAPSTQVSAVASTPTPAPTTQSPPTHLAYSYGYGHPQAAYPHTPYYATGYPYPYTYPTMQNGYHHPPQPPPPPPHAPSYPQPQPPTYSAAQTSMYNSFVPLPPPQDVISADDLPSYEEMLVEALTDCTEPDGLAPKDLFTWMASRYPLQSNFRPSASQALQKAFRRGRFEKSSNGRYRLNATWEGGNTSRRTTRRPQIQGNLQPQPTTTGSSTAMPPFTHAPLVHHHHGHSSSSTNQQYPYGHSYPGYAGYGAQRATSSAGVASSSTAAKTVPAATADAPTADAYEAAQNILKAINFGSLLSMPPEDDRDESRVKDDQGQEASSIANGVENLLSHVQAVLAANAAGSEAGHSAGAAGVMVPTLATPPADPRAELQAQLALLSAQLAELGQSEGEPTPLSAAPPATEPAPVHVVSPVPAPVQEELPLEAMPEENDESDDDDMEEVI